MICFKCQSEFDSQEKFPKLLIGCGHTLCQKCCSECFSNGIIKCLECNSVTKIHSISSLPNNMALLKIIPSVEQLPLECQKHNKKYQAFCSKQKVLICIECIIEDNHKNHEIDSIPKAYEKQFNLYNSKITKLQEYLSGIKRTTTENLQHQQGFRNQFQKIKELIFNTFKAIKTAIDEQEAQVQSIVNEFYKLQNEKFEDKNTLLNTKTVQVEHILQEIDSDCNLNQIAFLEQVNERDSSYEKLKFNSYESNKASNFVQTKNSLIEGVVKTINNLKANVSTKSNIPTTATNISNHNYSTQSNHSSVQNFSSNPNPSLNAAKVQHSQSQSQKYNFNSVEPMRGFKKAAFSNINSQNLKPQPPKKPNVKKQSISHHIQQSTTSRNPQKEKPVTTCGNPEKQKVLRPSSKSNRSSQSSNNSATPNSHQLQHQHQNQSSQQKLQRKIIKKIDIIESNEKEKNPIMAMGDLSVVNMRQSLCNSFVSNMTCFLSEKKSIYIVGGFNDQQNNNMIKFNLNENTFETDTNQMISLNSNRSKFGSAFVNNQIYLIGGKKGKQRLRSVESYNILNEKWTNHALMLKNKSGFGVIQHQALIYVIGGNDGESILNEVDVYNTETREWSKIPPMLDCRDQLAVSLGKNDGKIYAIGGFGGKNSEPLNTVEMYDPQTKKWTYVASMKKARRALSAALLLDGIYAIGGFNGQSYMASVERFDELKGQWEEVTPMTTARCTHSSIANFETQEIFVFGGFDCQPLTSVEKFSLVTNKWEKITEMPHARFMHSCVLVTE